MVRNVKGRRGGKEREKEKEEEKGGSYEIIKKYRET